MISPRDVRRALTNFILAVTLAHAADPAPVRVTDLWARASSPTATAGGAFATIINDSDRDDALISATCDAAESVELHTHVKGADGMLHMTEVERIAVPAHSRVELKPGGYHLMLFDLKRRLIAGEPIAMTLRFEKAGQIQANGTVASAGAMGPEPR